MAREAAKVAEEVAYERGVEETEIRLAEEVARVCKDYCTETWTEALNNVEVPTDSKLRKAESIFSLEHIREALADLFLTTALPSLLLSRLPISKTLLLMLKSPQEWGRVRRPCPQTKTLTPRMPLRSRMWSFRLKKLSQSLKLGMLSSRPLIPKRALNPQRSSLYDFSLLLFHFLLLLLLLLFFFFFWLWLLPQFVICHPFD